MTTEIAQTPPAENTKRKRNLIIIAIVVFIVAIVYGMYWVTYASKHETTDNAYAAGNIVQITSQINGTINAITVRDTDFVRAGHSVVKLDGVDTQVALDQARARLAQTVREVRNLYSNNATLKANVELREADITRAKNELARAKEDLSRRQAVAASGAVSKEELQHAQTNLHTAQSAEVAAVAAALAAKEQLASNKTLTEGVRVEKHPNVLAAASKFREAYINMARTNLVAPVSGYVARRSAQLGQRIQAGAPLMAIIPMDQLWIDANFKEVQLRKLRIGQPAEIISDAFGKNVTYHGTIEGLGAGTGAAFALLPAQNATGNWIKVVQRVPVRIKLDPKELADHPLRIGLSMEVDVDVGDQSGAPLSTSSHTEKASTAIDLEDSAMDAEIHKIIASNLGSELAKSSSAKSNVN